MKLIESKRRNSQVEENLALFEDLIKGTKEAQKFCLRAKIDMSSVNGTMRDPVLFRFNETPHHRTGTTYKAYPTYDFACPVIDSIEGVTHALRTTEYNDRDEQYHWIQRALGLRHVYIQAFGKMNFVNTVLSKRKLAWFVENKLVEGWFDPRFPTVQGCMRRGVNVDALKHFIISQGASRRVITMEWDKFWAENKKVLEEKCPRYMAVACSEVVPFEVENWSSFSPNEQSTLHTVLIHPSKPEHGSRVMRRAARVLVDQADAATYAVGEEVTLLRWGNMKITAIDKDSATGKIKSIRVREN
jgi:glutamyl/glutaminyl-tRNA synthetase